MDILEIFINEYDNYNFSNKKFDVVEFYVNGKNLIDVLDSCFRKENISFDKNKYIGINPQEVFLPSTNLIIPSEHPTLIYTCSKCGEPSCNSIHVQIILQDDFVLWKNFTNSPSAADNDFEDIKISKSPIFIFSRKSYEAALKFNHLNKS